MLERRCSHAISFTLHRPFPVPLRCTKAWAVEVGQQTAEEGRAIRQAMERFIVPQCAPERHQIFSHFRNTAVKLRFNLALKYFM